MADGKNDAAARDLRRSPQGRRPEAANPRSHARRDPCPRRAGDSAVGRATEVAGQEQCSRSVSARLASCQGVKSSRRLSAELADAAPERASLIVFAIGDRDGAALPPAVLEAATAGDKQVRLAAIERRRTIGRRISVPALLEIAADSDAELSQAAKTALAELPGEKVNAEIARSPATAKGKSLPIAHRTGWRTPNRCTRPIWSRPSSIRTRRFAMRRSPRWRNGRAEGFGTCSLPKSSSAKNDA